MQKLRMRLRSETRPEHERIDALYGRYDLRSRDDLAAFLNAHAIALSWCLQWLPSTMWSYRYSVDGLIGAIANDLANLGQPSVTSWPADRPGISGSPLGMVYVIGGSRLGGRVLLKTITGSPDPVVAAATDYLTCEHGNVLWRDVLDDLNSWTGTATEEQRILEGAKSTFRLFGSSFHAIQLPKAEHDIHHRVA